MQNLVFVFKARFIKSFLIFAQDILKMRRAHLLNTELKPNSKNKNTVNRAAPKKLRKKVN